MLEFVKRNYEVIALAPFDAEVKKALADLNIRFIEIPLSRNGTNPYRDLKLLLTLRQIFRLERPNIVFSYTVKPVIYASLAAKSVRISHIYSLITGAGYIFAEHHNWKNKLVGGVAKKLFKMALRANLKIFFQNPDNLALFLKEKIIEPKKPTFIINGSGVNCDWFAQASFPKNYSFIMIARLLKDKGVCEYVAAAKAVKLKYPEAKFKLVGWIDTNPNAISQVELNEWIQQGYIEYLGTLSDVRAAIQESSIYVLPSYHEGTPRTVLEAMAMGRPIITTDAPGCRETVLPQQNGFLVPVKSVDELAKAMEYFIKNPQKILEMGQESRNIAENKYEVNKVNAAILKEMEITP